VRDFSTDLGIRKKAVIIKMLHSVDVVSDCNQINMKTSCSFFIIPSCKIQGEIQSTTVNNQVFFCVKILMPTGDVFGDVGFSTLFLDPPLSELRKYAGIFAAKLDRKKG